MRAGALAGARPLPLAGSDAPTGVRVRSPLPMMERNPSPLEAPVLAEPTILYRDEQPYVARRESVTMTEFARVADHLPAMFGTLGERGVTPAV